VLDRPSLPVVFAAPKDQTIEHLQCPQKPWLSTFKDAEIRRVFPQGDCWFQRERAPLWNSSSSPDF
jgi:hypothetical protein